MKLIHTLLFLIRENNLLEDKSLATACLKSLEKSMYKTVVVYNQGYLTNDQLKEFLGEFDLNCIVIGSESNVGTVVGRQSCFEYIWDNYPKTEFISELHLDMIFPNNWEDPLVSYLDNNDEPMISSGIVDQQGNLPFLDSSVGGVGAVGAVGAVDAVDAVESDPLLFNDFLINLRCNKIVHGFTNPCIHVSKILKLAGGYNPNFLVGKQCFEDDSMLLGYYYYYGTRLDWKPKVNFNSVVYHAIAGQRLGISDSVLLNFNGLVKQYGAMGLKHLSQLHKSSWQINYFNQQYNIMNIKGD